MSERDDAGSRPPLGFWDLGVAVERKVPSDAGSERLCVAVLVTDPEDRVLLVQSGKGGDRGWEFPGGNVDPGEDPRKAARREVIEETGLDVTLTSAGPLTLPKSARHRGVLLFHGRAEGEPRPGSDAIAAGWFAAGEVEQLNQKGLLSDLASREVLLKWARERRVEEIVGVLARGTVGGSVSGAVQIDGNRVSGEILLDPLSAARVLAADPPSAPGFTVRFASAEDAGRLLGLLVGLRILDPKLLGGLGDRTKAIIAALSGSGGDGS